jgi:hypothetical protein
MKVHLTRGLHLDGKHYAAGPQEIDDAALKSVMFAKHIKAGNVLDVADAPKKVSIQTPAERAEILLEKLHGKQKKNLTPAQAEALSPSAPPPKESDDVPAAKDSKPKKK